MENLSKEGVFTKEFQILYSQINSQYQLKTTSAVDILQDTAIAHSNFVGYTLDFLMERHLAWLLKGWSIEFLEPICESSKIYVNTWTKAFKKLQADRNFIVYSADDKPLIKATSRWFLIDTQKRRPLKIDDFFMKGYCPSTLEAPILDTEYKQFKVDEKTSHSFTKSIVVENSHLDINNHVNNGVYILWALDCLSLDFIGGKYLKRIDSIYINEVSISDEVLASVYLEAEESCEKVLVEFTDVNKDKIFAQVRLSFDLSE